LSITSQPVRETQVFDLSNMQFVNVCTPVDARDPSNFENIELVNANLSDDAVPPKTCVPEFPML
jgi:hypothetical protein